MLSYTEKVVIFSQPFLFFKKEYVYLPKVKNINYDTQKENKCKAFYSI